MVSFNSKYDDVTNSKYSILWRIRSYGQRTANESFDTNRRRSTDLDSPEAQAD